jgi:hypothetical protein
MSDSGQPTKTIPDFEATLTKADTSVASFETEHLGGLQRLRIFLQAYPVAVPIFGQSQGGRKRVIAAINCSTSTTRISQDELVRTRLPLLRAAAGEIEASLRRWPVLEASLRPR